MTLTMNQYRPNEKNPPMVPIKPILSYKGITIAGDADDDDESSFQDVLISPANGQFIQERDYFLEVQVPQDANYTLTFDVQLIKAEDSDTNFQHIKRVSIPRGSTTSNVYNVVLYEDLDRNVKAMIPLPYTPGASNTRNYLYQQGSTSTYYLGNGGTSYTRCNNFNDMSMIASWKQLDTEKYGTFQMVFTPIDSGFSYIHLKMVRTAEDYNIQRATPNGGIEYGRKLDLDKLKCSLYSITDLIPSMIGTDNTSSLIKRIGVWGHPGMLMAINGEEIRITANGYYELDDFVITRLGIVSSMEDAKDFFTIDYSYEEGEG